MRSAFIILILALLSVHAYSQSKNTVSLVYGEASYDVAIWGVIGDFGYKQTTGNIYGLNYSRNFTRMFSLETGLNYSNSQVVESSIVGGIGEIYHYGTIKMLSVPAIGKFTFFKYLYADIGLNIDFQTDYTSNSPAPDQSGIGMETGVGAKYSFRKVMLFVNPFWQFHSVIRFNKGENFNLLDSGVKFGVGYSF